MAAPDAFRERSRATWAAGDWDGFARLVAPGGDLERFDTGDAAGTRVRADYLLIAVER
jgi:hypothetical protein